VTTPAIYHLVLTNEGKTGGVVLKMKSVCRYFPTGRGMAGGTVDFKVSTVGGLCLKDGSQSNNWEDC